MVKHVAGEIEVTAAAAADCNKCGRRLGLQNAIDTSTLMCYLTASEQSVTCRNGHSVYT